MLLQFLLRRQVLALYRESLRIIREEKSPDSQKQLKDWIRYEIESKKGITDPVRYAMCTIICFALSFQIGIKFRSRI